jgi:diguanylate cyclase (GGDEF)-like protein
MLACRQGMDATSETKIALADVRQRNLLAQEMREMHQRARLGGFFYPVLASVTLLSAGIGGQPWLALGAPMLLLVLALTRLAPVPADPGRVQAEAHLRRLWTIVLVTAAVWGAFSAWATLRLPEPAPLISLLSSGAFGMALAHVMCMRKLPAALAIALVTGPSLVLLLDGALGLLVVWAVYVLYMLMVMRRSHREYRARLELEEDLRQQRDLFERQSRVDGLTGLANRREFTEVLERRVAQVASGAGVGLVILDVDHFKRINDTHGHAVGDACLEALAIRLGQHFDHPGELCARLGGEEFGVVFGTGSDTMAARIEGFRAELEHLPLQLATGTHTVMVSIGAGMFDRARHDDADALYRDVDAALYRAKLGGRNQAQWVQASGPDASTPASGMPGHASAVQSRPRADAATTPIER